VGIWPLCRLFGLPLRESTYTTLLMATGLTFGSISALFGLTHGYIDQAQYSVLVAGVIASAVIPTIIAQVWFQPREVRVSRELELGTVAGSDHFLHMPEEERWEQSR
jgi:Kef-type K+ transport system membrane component KefB